MGTIFHGLRDSHLGLDPLLIDGLSPALIEAAVTCFGRRRLEDISLILVVEYSVFSCDIDQPLAINGPRVHSRSQKIFMVWRSHASWVL